MPATIIDSSIFGNIFSTDDMRRVWSDENRTAHYLAIEKALRGRAAPADALNVAEANINRIIERYRRDSLGADEGARPVAKA